MAKVQQRRLALHLTLGPDDAIVVEEETRKWRKPVFTGRRARHLRPHLPLVVRRNCSIVFDVIRAKHYSRRTESAYVDWIRRYILFHKKRHPSEMGAQEITSFLTWLASSRRVSASTQNQALSAILFLYRDVLQTKIGTIEHLPRARMPVRVPVVLSRDEVASIMKHLDGVAWIIVALLYGAGRLELRVKDIDLVVPFRWPRN
jgi:integrase